MLKIKDMNLNSVIRQGDTQPREYQLDTGNLNLNLANKQATIRLMTGDYKGIAYETTATVSSENKISFSIDDVIPAREYRLEITVDDYVFPSRATDGRFDIDPSSHGQEVNIIQIIGKDEIVREVKSRVENELEPFLGEIEQAELDRQAQEEARETAEGERETAEAQRKADHANRSAEFDGKADKAVLKNLVENGDFSEGFDGWNKVTGTDTYTIDEGIITINNGASGSGIARDAPDLRSGKYYISARYSGMEVNVRFRVGLGGAVRATQFLPDSENMTTYSAIKELKHDDVDTLMVVSQDTLSPYKIDTISIINLTETSGPGNEPTKEEMDELIENTVYIDGEYALNNKEMLFYLMNDIREKANKEQEEWITPTLINGWHNGSNSYNEPQYKKDEFGRVHVKGFLQGGTGTAFTLPVGYRPTRHTYFALQTSIHSIRTMAMISFTTGDFTVDGDTSKPSDITISFNTD